MRHWLGFLAAEARHLGRDLTDDEIETCSDIYRLSATGWKKTKQDMRRILRRSSIVSCEISKQS